MQSVFINRLELELWPRGYRRDIWMVVDAARDQRIFGLLLESRLEFSCLYTGPLHPALETLAPYLVQLEHEDRRCRRFLELAWGHSWGIFIKCDTTLERLRKHLRGFLSVRDPGGLKLLFRYYDPRVLQVYLPSCSSEDLRVVFGPIDRFWAEGAPAGTISEFALDGNRLRRNDFSLAAGSPRPAKPISPPAVPLPVRQRPGMLSMGKEQLAVFSQAEVRKFEDWMLSHLGKFFPRECRTMDETNLRDIIQYGIKTGASYGLFAKRDVCKYIDVMIVLGRDFPKNKRYTWAPDLLGRKTDSATKMRAVLSAAKRSLRNRQLKLD